MIQIQNENTEMAFTQLEEASGISTPAKCRYLGDRDRHGGLHFGIKIDEFHLLFEILDFVPLSSSLEVVTVMTWMIHLAIHPDFTRIWYVCSIFFTVDAGSLLLSFCDDVTTEL